MGDRPTAAVGPALRGGAPAPRVRWRPLRAAIHGVALAATVAATGCTGGGHTTPPPMPPAEVYDAPPRFDGAWSGEVDELQGSLEISELSQGVYRGVYRSGAAPVEYILKLEQTMHSDDGAEGPVPTNRMTFTWQDGRGGRGTGWLMINRANSALTGAFGEGAGHQGGRWTFRRAVG